MAGFELLSFDEPADPSPGARPFCKPCRGATSLDTGVFDMQPGDIGASADDGYAADYSREALGMSPYVLGIVGLEAFRTLDNIQP